MASHWVIRRCYTPYAVILYHPCGEHSFAPIEHAESKSYGTGEKCPGCVQVLARKKQVA